MDSLERLHESKSIIVTDHVVIEQPVSSIFKKKSTVLT